MNIAFIGFGNFGRAIASLLAENGVRYEYAGRNERLTKHADILFITVPTQSIRDALIYNKDNISNNTIIVNCSKGLEEVSNLLPHQIVQDASKHGDYFCLTGPSFASELIDKKPTVVSLGYSSDRELETVSYMLRTGYCRVVDTPDYQAAELAGAMKNVYAILCGYAEGMGYKTNTLVRIILEAQLEIVELAKSMGYQVSDDKMPAILGDLILTCSSRTSRNHSYGIALARNKDTDPHEGPARVVEGFHTCKSILSLSKQYNAKPSLALLASRIASGATLTKLEFESYLFNQ